MLHYVAHCAKRQHLPVDLQKTQNNFHPLENNKCRGCGMPEFV